MAFVRRLSDCAAELPDPPPPDVAAQVLRRRAAGERTDLDAEGLVYG